MNGETVHPPHPPRSGTRTRKHRFQVVPPGDGASVLPPEGAVHLLSVPRSGDAGGGRTAVLEGAHLALGFGGEGVPALLGELLETGTGLLGLRVVAADGAALQPVLAVDLAVAAVGDGDGEAVGRGQQPSQGQWW